RPPDRQVLARTLCADLPPTDAGRAARGPSAPRERSAAPGRRARRRAVQLRFAGGRALHEPSLSAVSPREGLGTWATIDDGERSPALRRAQSVARRARLRARPRRAGHRSLEARPRTDVIEQRVEGASRRGCKRIAPKY